MPSDEELMQAGFRKLCFPLGSCVFLGPKQCPVSARSVPGAVPGDSGKGPTSPATHFAGHFASHALRQPPNLPATHFASHRLRQPPNFASHPFRQPLRQPPTSPATHFATHLPSVFLLCCTGNRIVGLTEGRRCGGGSCGWGVGFYF